MNPKFTAAVLCLKLIHQGKTRDTFETRDSETLLIVATNRLSTHNVIHLSEVPHKGQVLTALTIFWLKELLEKNGIKHHLVAYGTDIYKHLPGNLSNYPKYLHNHAIIVKKLKMFPVEFIYRKYMTGSLFKNFYSKGLSNPYGLEIEPGLQQMSEFGIPVFTPTDKSATDEPLNAKATRENYPSASVMSLEVFTLISDYLKKLGLELVDSKFEIGVDNLECVTIADEIATPDSSRFCEISEITLGNEPSWLDKQVARDEAERIWGKGEKHPLEFNSDIIRQLSATYLRIFHRITGMKLQDFQHSVLR